MCVSVCVYGGGVLGGGGGLKKHCQGEEMTPEDEKDTEVLIDASSP